MRSACTLQGITALLFHYRPLNWIVSHKIRKKQVIFTQCIPMSERQVTQSNIFYSLCTNLLFLFHHTHKNVVFSGQNKSIDWIYLFGVLRRFQHCTGHITTGSWKGRGNQYIKFARVLYCKLLTNGKQLPAFPLTAMTGIEPRPQRWEARVLPLCHRGPFKDFQQGVFSKINDFL